jgi:hypothetical protein
MVLLDPRRAALMTTDRPVADREPLPGKPKFVRCPLGYEVYRSDDYYVGIVYPVEMASHIRRGRAQASPWWMAQMPDGTQVVGPDPYRLRRTVDRWQRRTDAADRLVELSRG